jgi:hypothetical protein
MVRRPRRGGYPWEARVEEMSERGMEGDGKAGKRERTVPSSARLHVLPVHCPRSVRPNSEGLVLTGCGPEGPVEFIPLARVLAKAHQCAFEDEKLTGRASVLILNVQRVQVC